MAGIDWKAIPQKVDASVAPFDGEEYLLYADSATVDVVRLACWLEPRENPCKDGEFWDGGWWSARHSVTTEHLDFSPLCSKRTKAVTNATPDSGTCLRLGGVG